MASFLKSVFYFALSSLIVSILLLVGYVIYYRISLKDIPAPDLSDSYSYNEKMEFLRRKSRSAGIITVGSSLSLNNLDSEIITESLHSTAYMNLSSWGMSMKDIFLLLKIQAEIYHPRVLLIASGIMDFQSVEKNVKYPVLKDYLRSRNSEIFYHLKCFNLKYYIDNFKDAQKVRSITNSYDYLGYDEYGGVTISAINFKINKMRWNNDYLSVPVSPVQYSYLDSISDFCKRNEIRFLFFQSPYRAGLKSSFDSLKRETLENHISKVKSILDSNGHSFVNATKSFWVDDLFIDGTHFNAEGAKKFTKYCFDDLGSRAQIVVSN